VHQAPTAVVTGSTSFSYINMHALAQGAPEFTSVPCHASVRL